MGKQADEITMDDLLPRLKGQGYDAERVAKRRSWVEKKTGAKLDRISGSSLDFESARGNIENPIGAAEVPLGVAGPLLVHGEHARGLFYVPMATTEGALIRSYERGMVALTRAGGVQTAILQDENPVNPTFFFPDVEAAARFTRWIPQQIDQLRAAAAETTRHGRLESLKCFQLGRQVIVDFGFSTGDAQGMNMSVKAARAICGWIEAHHPIERFSIFSGMSSEKHASGYALTRGKGKRVTAGALVPNDILRMYLHVTAEQMARVWQSTVVGQLQADTVGYNGHIANGLAAIFIATGQDVANVVNSSCGITTMEAQPEGLYASVTLPALSLATVGGGAGLGTQQEALEMMGCAGDGNAKKLAEIVAAALLGGELSMGAAIASDEFVGAHERYGRNRPRE